MLPRFQWVGAQACGQREKRCSPRPPGTVSASLGIPWACHGIGSVQSRTALRVPYCYCLTHVHNQKMSRLLVVVLLALVVYLLGRLMLHKARPSAMQPRVVDGRWRCADFSGTSTRSFPSRGAADSYIARLLAMEEGRVALWWDKPHRRWVVVHGKLLQVVPDNEHGVHMAVSQAAMPTSNRLPAAVTTADKACAHTHSKAAFYGGDFNPVYYPLTDDKWTPRHMPPGGQIVTL